MFQNIMFVLARKGKGDDSLSMNMGSIYKEKLKTVKWNLYEFSFRRVSLGTRVWVSILWYQRYALVSVGIQRNALVSFGIHR